VFFQRPKQRMNEVQRGYLSGKCFRKENSYDLRETGEGSLTASVQVSLAVFPNGVKNSLSTYTGSGRNLKGLLRFLSLGTGRQTR
jgi:hypothetical protein